MPPAQGQPQRDNGRANDHAQVIRERATWLKLKFVVAAAVEVRSARHRQVLRHTAASSLPSGHKWAYSATADSSRGL